MKSHCQTGLPTIHISGHSCPTHLVHDTPKVLGQVRKVGVQQHIWGREGSLHPHQGLARWSASRHSETHVEQCLEGYHGREDQLRNGVKHPTLPVPIELC